MNLADWAHLAEVGGFILYVILMLIDRWSQMVKWGKPYLPKIALAFLILGIIGAGYSYYARSQIPYVVHKTQYGDNNSPTQTPDANYETYELTNLAHNTVFTAPIGSWSNNQKMIIKIISTGTYTLDFTTARVYAPIGVILPTTTVPNKLLSLGIFYNASRSRWEVVAVAQEN